ncbi:MAG: metallophosphoesterase [bacterium]|nr:metallophosphoesterase [bacterium]
MHRVRLYRTIAVIIILVILASSSALARFRFAVMADSRKSKEEPVNVAEFQKVLAQMKKVRPQPQFVFFPGDMVRGMDTSYSGMTHQYTVWKNTVTAYYPISFFYLGMGNHETYNGHPDSQAERAFVDIFSEFKATEFLPGYNRTVYYLDYDNSRLFMLNTNHINANHQVDSTQREWVSRNLNQKTHNFIFMHEPAYPISSHIGSSLDVIPTERDAFWKIVDTANVSAVFVGHEHYYARRHIDSAFNPEYKNKIYQVTTGSCGAPLYTAIALNMLNKLDSNKRFLRTTNIDVHPISAYHFALVDVARKKVITTVYTTDGKMIDRFEVERNEKKGK